MGEWGSAFKLIILLAIAVGMVLLYFVYLILFSPNGVFRLI